MSTSTPAADERPGQVVQTGRLEPPLATPLDDKPPKPPQSGRPEGHGYGPVLRQRPFLLLWVAQICSQTAQNALNYGLIVEVERLTNSSTSVSLVVASFTIPALLLGPPAGALVDRLSKRWVLALTNLSRALLVVAFLATDRSVLAIYALTMLNSAFSQFFAPAEIATIPLVMPRRHLLAANSLFNMSFTLTQVLGFVLLGPTMLKLAGPLGLFAVITAAYALAGLSVALMPRLEQHLPPPHIALLEALRGGALWRDLGIGFEFLRTNRAVRTMLVLLSVTIAIVYLLATLGPGYVSRVLGFSPEDAGYVLGPAGLGILPIQCCHWPLGTAVEPHAARVRGPDGHGRHAAGAHRRAAALRGDNAGAGQRWSASVAALAGRGLCRAGWLGGLADRWCVCPGDGARADGLGGDNGPTSAGENLCHPVRVE